MSGFKHRLFIIASIMCVLFFVDVFSLFKLQIIDANKYFVLSEKNRIRTRPIFPMRGEIYDRNDTKIAINAPIYRLMIINSRKKDLIASINKLRDIIEIKLTNDEILFKSSTMSLNSCICLKDALTWNEYVKLTLHMSDFNNVIMDCVYTRKYVEPLAIGHILGYVGANQNNEACIEGKSGIEFSQNEILFGVFGNKKVEVDAKMRFVRTLDYIAPIDGESIKLSIDIRLQKHIYSILSEYNAASCIVLDLKNGHILGAVSVPGIDTNMMSCKISYNEWEKILNDKYLPMNNRVVRTLYSPGSVFKVFLAYSAIATGKISPNEKIICNGYTSLGKDKFRCWNHRGHGPVNLYQAIACSCDVYFHEVARRMGIDDIGEAAHMFGFGQCVCPDVSNELKGLVPDKKWKQKRFHTGWKEYDTILIGTGQGYLLSNIMQVATGIARIATGNSAFTPTLLFDKNGNIFDKPDLNKDALDIVRQAMYQVCNSRIGTAYRSCNATYGIAGKTGSTQVRRMRSGEHGKSQDLLKWEERDHALFAGFAPFKEPKYVVAVIIEHGGGGGHVAAPVARKIFDWLMNENSQKNKK